VYALGNPASRDVDHHIDTAAVDVTHVPQKDATIRTKEEEKDQEKCVPDKWRCR
jgi:hypothetical protein